MSGSPNALRSLAVAATCLGIACGVDTKGIGALHDDGGALAILDDAGGIGSTPANAGAVGPSSGGGMSSDGASAALGGDAGATTTASDASAAAASGESGSPSLGTGSSDAGDGAAGDGGISVGGPLCGPNSTMSCGQGQYCDPALGCVSCLMDSQCPASMRWCLQGSCVQCRKSNDCGNGTTPACWPADHTCHAACTTNQQCQDSGATLCNVATGVCVGCNTSHDCSTSQPVCSPLTQQCVQCANSSDCAGTSTPACVHTRCVACATNADCSGNAPYCSAGGDNGPRCVQCVQNSQCPPNAPSCNGGTCGQPG